jgi:hypothetical protein
MMSPALGMSQLIAPSYLPGMLNHLKEHVAMWYAASVFELGNEATGGDIGDMLKELSTPEDKRAFDGMLAEASQTVAKSAGVVFQSLPAVIQQVQQVLQSFAPQPPSDPNFEIAQAQLQQQAQLAQAQLQLQAQRDQQRGQIDGQKLQLSAAESQQKAQVDQAKLQVDQAKLQLEQAKMQLEAQQKQQKLAADVAQDQSENQLGVNELMVRQAINTQDNMTAMELAKLELETGERFSVSTGTGINPQAGR